MGASGLVGGASRPWTLAVRDALAGVRAGALDGDTFLRSVMHHPGWLVAGRRLTDASGQPSGLELGVIRKEQGAILEAYADEEALALLERQDGAEFTGAVVRLGGVELFSQLDRLGVARVNLNPGSPDTVHYKREQVPLLAAWARRCRVELALHAPERLPDPLVALRDHDEYHIVVQRDAPDSASFVLAPDEGGRQLAAIFTCRETAEAFAEVLAPRAEAPLEVLPQPAERLFRELQALGLDGLVFDPLGPAPARALAAGVLEHLVPAPYGVR